MLKSLVVKLKGASTVGNPTNSLSEATVQFAKVFLGNVRGVVFYAVPHAGGGNIAKFVNKLFKCHNRQRRGIMDNIQDWNRDMGDLSVDFDLIVNENKINIYAFCEGRPTNVVRMCWMNWIFCNCSMMYFAAEMCRLGCMTGLGKIGDCCFCSTVSKS